MAKSISKFQKLQRRTFLFILGLVGTNLAYDYFAVAKNRTDLVNFLGEGFKKVRALLNQSESIADQTPIISTPSPQPTLTPLSQQPNLPETPIIPPKPQPSQVPQAPIAKAKPVNLTTQKGKPVLVELKSIHGISFYQTTIDLTDPEIFLEIGLANQATQANSAAKSYGDETFEKLVSRHPAAIVANGTFFSKDVQKRVLGNVVSKGRFLKYSRWENYGTTLGIKAGNQLEMVTARTEGKPEWNEHWFSLTCGPRLLKQGKIWLSPKSEGFTDPHVLDRGYRTALGFPKSQKQLILVAFLESLSLQQEAELMQAIGCYEAMNLDGGASTALAHNQDILIQPGRPLTNVIIVYDTNYPAPASLKQAWQNFQAGKRPQYPKL